MNNKEISQATGLSPAEVTRILNREKYGRDVTFRQAYKLAGTFGKSMNWWLTATPDKIRRVIDRLKG